jgi:hypothetical protein
MNIALPALIVFALLLPGFIARARFKLVERQSLDYAPFGRIVTNAVLTATALHFVWILIIQMLMDRQIDFELLLGLMSSSTGAQEKAIARLAPQAGDVACYFGSLLAFSALAPAGISKLIVRYGLDRQGRWFSWMFRFDEAPWYYLLKGTDFSTQDRPDLIRVSALVDVAGAPVLYVGVLNEFFVDSEGCLERLVLENVVRRPFGRDKKEASTPQAERFYPIDGKFFVLRYAEAITLNVEYVKLEKSGSANELNA